MQTIDTPFITNQEVARILFQTGALLDMMECNPFRVRAYRRAALGVLFLPQPVAEYVLRGDVPPIDGIGDGMRRKLVDLVNTGQMDSHAILIEEFGEPLASLLQIEGVGPKTAVRLVSELQVASLRDLADAAESGKIRALPGFGPRREARIGEAVRCHLTTAA